jgi:hypothetical protein
MTWILQITTPIGKLHDPSLIVLPVIYTLRCRVSSPRGALAEHIQQKECRESSQPYPTSQKPFSNARRFALVNPGNSKVWRLCELRALCLPRYGVSHETETTFSHPAKSIRGLSTSPSMYEQAQYALNVGDLQPVRVPPGQSVARSEATRELRGIRGKCHLPIRIAGHPEKRIMSFRVAERR